MAIEVIIQERLAAGPFGSLVDLCRRVDSRKVTRRVYEALIKGSRNHLRAFMQNLDAAGEPYAPQFLTQQAFDAIVDGSLETDCGAY